MVNEKITESSLSKIAFFDIDGTLVKGQTQVLLIRYLYHNKIIGTKSLLQVLVWYLKYKFFSADIDQRMAKEFYYSLFRGKGISEVNEIIEDYFETYLKGKIYPESAELLEKYRKDGFIIILFSATISPIAEKLSNYFKADLYFATEIEKKKNQYTGNVKGNIFIGTYRNDSINKYLKNRKDIDKISVLSDRASDYELFKLADEAIAVNPNRDLKKLAEENKWEIIKL